MDAKGKEKREIDVHKGSLYGRRDDNYTSLIALGVMKYSEYYGNQEIPVT